MNDTATKMTNTGSDAVDLDKLEALAKAATPGPWRECGHDRGGCKCGLIWNPELDEMVAGAWKGDDMVPRASVEPAINAAYIAAANPATVIALIAQARAAAPAADIKTWKERMETTGFTWKTGEGKLAVEFQYMQEEIDDLRAALASQPAPLQPQAAKSVQQAGVEVAPVIAAPTAPTFWNSQRKMIERAIIGLRDGWATRKDADNALAILAAAPTAKAEPAPSTAPTDEAGEADKLAALLCCLYEGDEILSAATMLIEQAMEIEELRSALAAKVAAPLTDARNPVAAMVSYWEGPTDAGNPIENCVSPLGWSEYRPTTLALGKVIIERGDPDKRVKLLCELSAGSAASAVDAIDTARLDYLAEHGGAVRRANDGKRNIAVWGDDFPNAGVGRRENLRIAIDRAAMAATQEKK